MPNWCDNSLHLFHSDADKVKALYDHIQSNADTFFEYLRPNPSGEWNYEWSSTNWGTKWDSKPSDCEYNESEQCIYVCQMDTAWCPPIALYEYLVVNGWEVNALYLEEGNGFCGTFDMYGDTRYNYDITDAESIEKLPEDLIEFCNIWERHNEHLEYEEEQRRDEKNGLYPDKDDISN